MKYKTCVSIGEKNPKELKIILKKALSKSDYAEIRFDYLKKSDIPKVLEDVKKNLTDDDQSKNEGSQNQSSVAETVTESTLSAALQYVIFNSKNWAIDTRTGLII